MQKIILTMPLLAALAFFSCKKERTCTCTKTNTEKKVNGQSTTPSSTVMESKHVMKDVTKKTAMANCVSRTEVETSTIGANSDELTYRYECKLD